MLPSGHRPNCKIYKIQGLTFVSLTFHCDALHLSRARYLHVHECFVRYVVVYLMIPYMNVTVLYGSSSCLCFAQLLISQN